MKQLIKNTTFTLALVTGLGLLFIGTRFLLAPSAAETGFGIHVPVEGNYSFHYIKGIRDLFTGLSITLLLLTKEYRALGVLLLAGAIVPTADLLIVHTQPGYQAVRLYPHLTAIVLAVVLGAYYFLSNNKK